MSTAEYARAGRIRANRIARFTLVGLELFLGITAVTGAVSVVPTFPPKWLAGTPFPDYTIPALALGVVVGGGAFLAAAMLLFHHAWDVLLSMSVGLAIAIFEVVETTVVGLDVWLHALGLRPDLGAGILGASLEGIPAPLGIPLPLWLQPFYFAIGVVIAALALRLRASASFEARPPAS
ncbi:MAG: hypothetical protein HY332_11565 [Chloroflexi bacterium]|nr:hypothetical protein [Chloroflexota bacterium]